MRDATSGTHVQQPAQHQSTSRRHPELPGALSGKHPLQLSERRQSASRVLKAFPEVRSLGRVRDKCSAELSRSFSLNTNRQNKSTEDAPWSWSPTVKRPALLQRQQMWKSSTLFEPVQVAKSPSISKEPFG